MPARNGFAPDGRAEEGLRGGAALVGIRVPYPAMTSTRHARVVVSRPIRSAPAHAAGPLA
jgi:hypothetical protein